MKPTSVIAILCLILASLACQVVTRQSAQSEPGEVIFQDDFSDPTTGWNRVNSAKGITDFADGMYRIQVNETDLDVWSIPGLDLADVRIEVDAIKIGGDRDNRFGVLCRVRGDKFYAFILSSDGYYGIGKMNGVQYDLIGMDAMIRSDVIQRGSEFNHIQVSCIGDQLTLGVNGKKLTQVRDSDFASGDVGIIAGTYDLPGVDIRFDNFMVRLP